jgi:hypothetical protein
VHWVSGCLGRNVRRSRRICVRCDRSVVSARRISPLGSASPRNVVSNLELGERRLDVLELLLFSDAVGIEPAEFLKRLRDCVRPPT